MAPRPIGTAPMTSSERVRRHREAQRARVAELEARVAELETALKAATETVELWRRQLPRASQMRV